MATLRDIQRRIRSVQSTQKITKAMKLVAASKFRRAQERILAARPYATKMRELLTGLAGHTGDETHPFLARRETGRRRLVIITADKGLCGGFNANIIRTAVRRCGGYKVDAHGDEYFSVFEHAAPAIETAVDIQRSLRERVWSDDVDVRVRAGIHSGRPTLTDTGYVGLSVHTVARCVRSPTAGRSSSPGRRRPRWRARCRLGSDSGASVAVHWPV